MKKIVINTRYGGFGLSDAAYEHLATQYRIPVVAYDEKVLDGPREVIYDRSLTNGLFDDEEHVKVYGRYWDAWTNSKRDDPRLVAAVEALGARANGRCAALAVIEIPDNIDWKIEEYDGLEHIAEAHRTWS